MVAFSNTSGLINNLLTKRFLFKSTEIYQYREFLFSFELPDRKERYEILKLHTKDRKLSKGVDLHKLAEETEHFSGSQINSICRKAAILALQELFSKNTQVDSKKTHNIEISQHHFNIALGESKKAILKFDNK